MDRFRRAQRRIRRRKRRRGRKRRRFRWEETTEKAWYLPKSRHEYHAGLVVPTSYCKFLSRTFLCDKALECFVAASISIRRTKEATGSRHGSDHIASQQLVSCMVRISYGNRDSLSRIAIHVNIIVIIARSFPSFLVVPILYPLIAPVLYYLYVDTNRQLGNM